MNPWLVPILLILVCPLISLAIWLTCRPEKEPKGRVLMPKPLTILTAYDCHSCGTAWGPNPDDLEPGEVIHHHFFDCCEQHIGELP